MARHLLYAVLVALLPTAAFADPANPSFYLVNRAGQAITQAYVSPVTAAGWGRDQLGDDTVDAGGNAPIRLRADGNCLFDLRVVYDDGTSEERRRVDTCAVDNITFGDTARPRGAPADPAHDPSFRIVNRGKREIDEVYLRQAGTTAWGRDRLGDDTVDAGAMKAIHMPPGQCLWDVRFVFEDGKALEKRRVNLCNLSDLPVP